ncbi:MAG: sulfurtransferase [Acidimicrobiia bacterium]|nr:sulfurtransferase [Acidimicrobiia bacterium]
MAWTTLVGAEALGSRLGQPDVAIVDCRFLLNDTAWGEREYRQAHIPGAAYAHLDRDLSGQKTGRNGRHPLPDPTALRQVLGRLGIGPAMQVVAYDQESAMYASRLWWLLRWMGHQQVAVLDGGFAAWQQLGGPTRAGEEHVVPHVFDGTPDVAMVASLEEVGEIVAGAGGRRLLDARAPERFRGDVEPLDAAAGHIPGAVNHFFRENIDADGRFRPADTLRRQLLNRLGDTPPDRVIAYCGSGVTACHNLLALEHAGLPGGRLYPGSWSEWSADQGRPIATGD